MLVYVLHKEKHVTFAVNKIISQQFVVRNSNECVTISQKNGKNKGQDFKSKEKDVETFGESSGSKRSRTSNEQL